MPQPERRPLFDSSLTDDLAFDPGGSRSVGCCGKKGCSPMRFAAGEFAGDRHVSGCDVGARDPGAHSFGLTVDGWEVDQDEHLLCA